MFFVFFFFLLKLLNGKNTATNDDVLSTDLHLH